MLIMVILLNSNILLGQNNDFSNLVWSDECNTEGGIDASKWFHQTKLPNGTSWWNNEVQHYTNRVENSFCDTGYMHIVAIKEEFTDQEMTKEYTSARLNSKFAFTYGKVEIRAMLPFGVGTWPAMWTLGKNVTENGGYWSNEGYGTTGWPECGEIDIMEHWGHNQNYVSSAMHTPSSYGGTVNKGGRTVATASTEFHVYKMEWSPEKMVFSIDDVVHYTYNPTEKNASTWPFDKDQYLLLNVAIQPDITDDFTESPMIIDYVRVYEYKAPSSVQLTASQSPVYYPSPFKKEVSIDLGEFPEQEVVLNMYSIDSRLVKSYRFPASGKIVTLENLGELSNGMYIITYELNNRRHSLTLAKN